MFFVFIIVAIVVVMYRFYLVTINAHSGAMTIGINGITETRCIGGYKFVIGSDGQARQIMDQFGKGVPCQ
jgi:hypothetical protein